MADFSLHPEIASLLSRLRRRIRAYVWLEGLAAAVAVVGVAFWVSLAVDYLREPPPAVRIAILAAGGLGLIFIVSRLILRRAFVRLSDRSMALLLERRHEALQDSLLTSVELGSQAQSDPLMQQMLATARTEALERSGKIAVGSVFNPRPLVRALVAGCALAASVAGFVLGAPEALGIWSRRTFQLSDELWPRKTHLEIDGFADGKVKVARGSDLELIVKADTAKLVPEVVEVRFRNDEGARGRENMVREGVADSQRDPYQLFSHKFQGLLRPLDFDVVGGDDRLRDLRIDVVDSPAITGMTLWCEFPRYMVREDLGLYTPRELPVSEFVQLPEGTKVTLRAKTNKPLVKVQIDRPRESGGVDTQTLDLSGKAERGFEHTIASLEEDTSLLFTLLDTDGIRNREPIRLTLSARPDEPPQVALRLRGIGTAITAAARLPIVGEINDDYGLARLWFEYAIDDGEEAQRPLSKLPRGAAQTKFSRDDDEAFDVRDELELKPKQKLLISVKAADTYDLDGEAHIGSSQRFVLDVVTPEQLRLLMEGRELNLRRRFEQIIHELTESRNSLTMVSIVNPPLPLGEGRGEGDGSGKGDDSRARATTPPHPSPLPKGEGTGAEEPAGSVASLFVQRAMQNGRKNAQETQGVAEGFDEIRDELVNNRLDTTELRTRLKDRIADPLKQIVQARFPELELRLETLLSRLHDMEKGPAALTAATEQMDQMLVEMNQVLSQMLELETFNEAIALLRSIMESQGQINEKTKKQRRSILEE